MKSWQQFTESAPHIVEIFNRRYAATGNLCMLATLRSDGFPRISPVEPQIFEDQLVLIGMPNTRKFIDLHRDPRFCLHTATVDTQVSDGDVKMWGTVENVTDTSMHQRFADALFEQTGMDLRGQDFDHFFVSDLISASSIETDGERLTITIWKPGEPEQVVHKGM